MFSTHAHASHRPSLLGLALFGALALMWMDLRTCHQRRLREKSRAKPEPLQTWEGEGGGIPAVRGTQTPTPGPVVNTS
ncbi:hypothetical protein HLB44_14535 [Aquincola sp. S2]|uniref:Uncharacterized protein n=1 Tax=Pseudaquabacterium terrae TaxID=2732868 RepID=A0ABX2EHV0_9BURK|nr:hypothetical protein [Aquabacterium terrae]NRF68207.1 hypothetical protein [Aquabacterium terrae]